MTHRLSKSKPCQKMHDIAWRLVNALMTEYCPTWCIAVQNRKLSTSSQLRLRLVLGSEPLKLTRAVSYIGHIWINLSATSESFTLTSSYLVSSRSGGQHRQHWHHGSSTSTMAFGSSGRIQQRMSKTGQRDDHCSLQLDNARSFVSGASSLLVATGHGPFPCLPEKLCGSGCDAKQGWRLEGQWLQVTWLRHNKYVLSLDFL